MPNDRLRDAFQRYGLTPESAAGSIGVDAKTIERWIRQGRTPYPRHRRTIAALVNEAESYLWPDAIPPERTAEVSYSEIVMVYPHRHQVPRELWTRLLDEVDQQLDILVYAGLFLTDNPCLRGSLRDMAESGGRVRILFGDPKSREVSRRSIEEGIGANTISAKIRNSIAFFEPIYCEQGIDVRLHKTTLYNSIYRFDNEMLVNTHVLGQMAGHSPVLHLRRLDGGSLFDMYAANFETVWNTSNSLLNRSSDEN